MWVRRALLVASVLLVAFVLQVSLLARLGLPGATPDLVFVVVITVGFAYGPITGTVTGFAAGLLLDLAPPSDAPVGLLALIGMAIGYLTAVAVTPRDRTVPIMLALVGGSTAGAVLVYALALAVTGSDRIPWAQVPGIALSAGIYGALIAMPVMPLIAWLVRRVTPEAVL